MSQPPFGYERTEFTQRLEAEDPVKDLERRRSNLGMASTKELAQHGLELAYNRAACIKDARGLRRLLAKLIHDEHTEFQEDFCGYRGVDDLADMRKRWLNNWREAGPTPEGFVYHFTLRYPPQSDPYAASVAAEDFSHKFSWPEYGGINRFILVHHPASVRPALHLLVDRLISGRFLVQTDFSMGHLKRLYLDTAREAGAVL
jgi:hypothetical protein